VSQSPAPEPGGDRPDLVLVHGLGSASSYWDNIRARLDERYRVVAPDLPGHGPRARTVPEPEAHPAALAAALVDRLKEDGVTAPHLVGVSLGGWVALEMAAQGFGRSVLALAPAGLWQAGAVGEDWWARFVRIMVAPTAPLLPLFSRLAPARALGLSPNVRHPHRVSPSQFTAAAKALVQARGYAPIDRALVHDRFSGPERITVPVTVAFGDHDRVLPAGRAQDFGLLPAHAEVHIVGSCGHAMTWDQPDRCLELLEATTARAA
jgi:pimeloyl-ACP methyl ester carboxylesterase